jgi:hypothetical protein
MIAPRFSAGNSLYASRICYQQMVGTRPASSQVIPQLFSNWRAFVACTLCGLTIIDGAPGDEILPCLKCVEWGAGPSA